MVNSISYNILMGDLEPLSKIIKGSNEPISNRQLIVAARQVLKQVEFRSTGKIYNNQQLQYINYDSAMASVYIKYKTYSMELFIKTKHFL